MAAYIITRENHTQMLSSIFFDAGNTLIFPDLSKTLAPLLAAGCTPDATHLYAAEQFAKKQLDAAMSARQPGQSVDHDFWRVYYQRLAEILKLDASPEMLDACVAATRRSQHWTRL